MWVFGGRGHADVLADLWQLEVEGTSQAFELVCSHIALACLAGGGAVQLSWHGQQLVQAPHNATGSDLAQ